MVLRTTLSMAANGAKPASPAPKAPSGSSANPSPTRDAETPEKFFFFWRGPLSQWAKSRFEIDGVTYCNGEQWMMAEKARMFGDLAVLDLIMARTDPSEIKRLGRDVKPFDEKRWVAARKDVIKRGNVAKFGQDPELAKILLSTEGHTLVEASPFDDIYGIKLKASDPRAQRRETWCGLNLLGEVLTEVRDELALQAEPGLFGR